ncbi:hypothetical protein Tco_1193220 [Tanacetum coccineum]
MLSLRERMELDLEVRLMGVTLVLNRSLDPLYGDYIELNDLNVPLEIRRDQVDDLIAHHLRKVEEDPIDLSLNLKISCMIVVENMDGYRDQDMGDIILGEPFCKASCVEAKRFDGLIHYPQWGVLNLGPEYVRDAKMEEWLTHRHISVHEMK